MTQLGAEISEARLLLRYCASSLSEVERQVLNSWLSEETLDDAAIRIGLTRGGVWMAQKRAFGKMRNHLNAMGITSTSQVFSVVPGAE